jgi:ATP-dependent protease ClpP protease subunit
MIRYRPNDTERHLLCQILGIPEDDQPSWYVENARDVSRETSAVSRETSDGGEGGSAAPDETRLYVHRMIGGWRQDSNAFVQAVHALTTDVIHLHVNSPGGIVFDAVAMYEALRTHPARKIVHVDGLAASAASMLAMVGDEIEIARGARMMIHDAQGGAWGSPAELRAHVELIDSVSDDLAEIYASRAGGTAASWRKAMSATTWYSAEQAVAAKLADRVAGGKQTKAGPDSRSRLIKARHRALTTTGG